MRCLIDTHILLWALVADRRLTLAARELLEDPTNEILVSAASYWELAIKTSIGKINVDLPEIAAAAQASGFSELYITLSHAAELALLPHHHRDPFDRMLLAQARAESLNFVTQDPVLRKYGRFVKVFA